MSTNLIECSKEYIGDWGWEF